MLPSLPTAQAPSPSTALIPVGPLVHYTPRTRADFIALIRAKRASTLSDLAASIEAQVTYYNRVLRTLPPTLRSRHTLYRIGFLWDDGPVPHSPPRSTLRILHDSQTTPKRPITISTQDKFVLRELARKNRVPIPQIWDRFPPTSYSEQLQMQSELTKWRARQTGTATSPKTRAATPFPISEFGAYLKRQAKDTARLAGDPSLFSRLLSDASWRAEQKARFDAISSIEIDIEI